MRYVLFGLLAIALLLMAHGVHTIRLRVPFASKERLTPPGSCESGADIGRSYPFMPRPGEQVYLCVQTGPGEFQWQRW